MARRRGTDESCARETRRRARRVVRLLSVLQLPVLPGVSRSAGRGRAGGPRAHRRARSGDRPSVVSAALSRRAGADVQLARRAGDDSDGLGQSRRARGRRGRRVGGSARRAAAIGSGRSTAFTDDLRSTSAASTRTRAARSCSSFSRRICRTSGRLSLLLIGQSLLPIPQHPRIRHLGFLDDADKFDAMAAADLLIIPSYFESLSMVALEVVGARPSCRGQRQVRRPEGPVHSEQRRVVLRELSGIRWPMIRSLEQSRRFGSDARGERPAVLPRPLRLAGHRTEVSRHVRTAEGPAACPDHGAAARLVRAPAPQPAAGRGRAGAAAAWRGGDSGPRSLRRRGLRS